MAIRIVKQAYRSITYNINPISIILEAISNAEPGKDSVRTQSGDDQKTALL